MEVLGYFFLFVALIALGVSTYYLRKAQKHIKEATRFADEATRLADKARRHADEAKALSRIGQ